MDMKELIVAFRYFAAALKESLFSRIYHRYSEVITTPFLQDGIKVLVYKLRIRGNAVRDRVLCNSFDTRTLVNLSLKFTLN
jgi:hypothetical protein